MIIRGDARAIPLADESVQCVVTTLEQARLSRLLVELSFTELIKQEIGLLRKFRGHTLKPAFAEVLAVRRVFLSKCIKFEAQFDLAAFALDIRKRRSEQSQAFLMNYSQQEYRETAAFSSYADDLTLRQERIDELHADPIGHGQSEANAILRGLVASVRQRALYADMAFRVECGQKGGRIEADHIKPWGLYPRRRYLLSNGRALCNKCHKKTDTYGWAGYWKMIRQDQRRLAQGGLFSTTPAKHINGWPLEPPGTVLGPESVSETEEG